MSETVVLEETRGAVGIITINRAKAMNALNGEVLDAIEAALTRMEKDDARYATLGQLHERRKQIVRLHRKGYGVMQIVPDGSWRN